MSSSPEEEEEKSSSDGDDDDDQGRAPLILQPPEDEQLGNAAAINYTWGTRIVRVEGGGEDDGNERVQRGGAATMATATTATETQPGKQTPEASEASEERLVWAFDKRKTTDASAVELLPRPQALPEAFDPRWRLAGSKTAAAGGWKRGKKVSRALYETLKAQVREINACIDWIWEREKEKVR